MILDSWVWKRDLARRGDVLQKRIQQQRWTEASCANVERDIFLSAYVVRKLLEAGKISDEVESTSLRAVEYYLRKECTVDIMNWHKLDELYDLSSGTETVVNIREYCNQIIHSFVFSLSFSESGGLDGFFVASDREKDRRLLYLNISTVAEALRCVTEDDVVTLQMSRNGVGMPMKIIKKSNQPPTVIR
jgi:hypothetical protein